MALRPLGKQEPAEIHGRPSLASGHPLGRGPRRTCLTRPESPIRASDPCAPISEVSSRCSSRATANRLITCRIIRCGEQGTPSGTNGARRYQPHWRPTESVVTPRDQWQPRQVNVRPWQTAHDGLSSGDFLLLCDSRKSRVWFDGFRWAPAAWQNVHVNGGSIFVWQTRQSAICG